MNAPITKKEEREMEFNQKKGELKELMEFAGYEVSKWQLTPEAYVRTVNIIQTEYREICAQIMKDDWYIEF